MVQHPWRAPTARLALPAAIVALLGACDVSTTSAPLDPGGPSLVLVDEPITQVPSDVTVEAGVFKVCKVGPDPDYVATFDIVETRNPGSNPDVTTSVVQIKTGTCKIVDRSIPDPLVRVTERLEPGWSVSHIDVRVRGERKNGRNIAWRVYTRNTTLPNTNTVEEMIGAQFDQVYPEFRRVGAVAIFHNVRSGAPEIEVKKTAAAATVDAGQPIGFTVQVTNKGTVAATGVTLSDPLPGGPGVSYTISSQTAAACTIAGTAPNQTLNCNLGTLAPNASYSVSVASPTTAGSCKVYNNTATVRSTNHADVQDAASVTVRCQPKLEVKKTTPAGTVAAGNKIRFDIEVKNTGSGALQNVSVSDALPTGTDIVWSLVSPVAGCTLTNNTLSCTFADLAPGTTKTISVESPTSKMSCKVYNNTVNVSSTNGGTANASASVTVQCPPPGAGSQGCTPGYWKQGHHFDSWPNSLKPTDSFQSVFGSSGLNGKSLVEVLSSGGGGINALGRHTVAALLNSATAGVDYGLNPSDVISRFQAAISGGNLEAVKDQFEKLNERGCPLN